MAHKLLYGRALNDVPNSTALNSLTRKIYMVWQGMLQRCYNEKIHERRPRYSECEVCERWLLFSNFLEDVVNIPNYELWLRGKNVHLDKDILSGHSAVYCPENCSFVTGSENSRESIKRNLPAGAKHTAIRCFYPDGSFEDFYSMREACRKRGFNFRNLWGAVSGRNKTHRGCRFVKIDSLANVN